MQEAQQQPGRNQTPTWLLYTYYTGDWTTFSQPGVLMVWVYVHNFTILLMVANSTLFIDCNNFCYHQ